VQNQGCVLNLKRDQVVLSAGHQEVFFALFFII